MIFPAEFLLLKTMKRGAKLEDGGKCTARMILFSGSMLLSPMGLLDALRNDLLPRDLSATAPAAVEGFEVCLGVTVRDPRLMPNTLRAGTGVAVDVTVQPWFTSTQWATQKTRRQATQGVAAGSRTPHEGKAHGGLARRRFGQPASMCLDTAASAVIPCATGTATAHNGHVGTVRAAAAAQE